MQFNEMACLYSKHNDCFDYDNAIVCQTISQACCAHKFWFVLVVISAGM